MRPIKIISILFAVMISDVCHSQKSELVPYIDFLEKQNTSAVDYVFDRYPGRVANVMLNYIGFTDTTDGAEYLNDRGKWDAVFKYFNDPALGFDMEGSPFGKVVFDYYPDEESVPAGRVEFKDVFTGFIFYKPISEMAKIIKHSYICHSAFPKITRPSSLPRRWSRR